MISSFKKAITLSKQIAASLLRDKKPTHLEETDLFSDEDKQYILKYLTKEDLIKQRLALGGQIDEKADREKILKKISAPVRKLAVWHYAAAAVLFIGLATTYFFKGELFQTQQTPPAVVDIIEAGINKATLTREDGEVVTLQEGTAYQSKNVISNGNQIVYNTSKNKELEVAYDYLTIPRGGQFFIQLSDSTKVWLNSESRLKYPVAFPEGKTREVELVYGEAYFEVSHSTEHGGADFKVYYKGQEIQVLGTEFNVKAYKDDTNAYTTLVKGRVAVSYQGKKEVLAPEQQSSLNLSTGELTVTEGDINTAVAWKRGLFMFKSKSLKEIMKVLERWYDVEILIQNRELEVIEFKGTLSRNQNLEEILNLFKNAMYINSYQVNNKTITIN
ncbi:DUF4974 domain-containing protein [Galbibacter sp. EGI 63066]|uniref:FecR family protein n=1 Tax=Galbibacter sp. EGI 63066 TaxID=2993559 RepID=UPI0022488F44|nr:FecR family protein [Galbibacter sp. EGI 63066]MCX2681970.1 DUF4974 domain-containing protein [Galbibacter sp. EGI 63066]